MRLYKKKIILDIRTTELQYRVVFRLWMSEENYLYKIQIQSSRLEAEPYLVSKVRIGERTTRIS